MPTIRRASLLCLLMPSFRLISANAPIATVFTTGSLVLSGNPIDMPGVLFWPVFDGDEITATTSNAVIVFRPAGRISLSSGSRLMLSGIAELKVRLIQGNFCFALPSNLPMTLIAPKQSLHSQDIDNACLSLLDSKLTISPRGGRPSVDLDVRRLLRRFPWTLGVYTPEELP